MQTQTPVNNIKHPATGIIINTIILTPGGDDGYEGDWDDEEDEEFDDLIESQSEISRIRRDNDWDGIDEDDDDHLPDDDLQ
ncbi:hypothetical protein LT679_14795 [Mucilaginibacter roseus]|uniref:Uncharacterized protein n=1 Tax=Mucilaginibacter roseus TaxID=1528868 RepID=A0ABS8U433_9SPHI|nr:hypothetical protein [Mucilaginibacter roseus]MCD8741881.1 hypothetical protein [Mucilaginibacter roseus]